jgi:NAD(P)-dependent dehydrogenase (short-subunit alcohol dehydrogenase family)
MPSLRRAGGGSIVNVASVHAMATMERVAAYAASKAAIVGLTRQMAIDYAPEHVRVNSLVVGGVETPMSKQHVAALGLPVAEAEYRAGDFGIGRTALPREVAEAALFLASGAASFVVGSALVVDGGALARLDQGRVHEL